WDGGGLAQRVQDHLPAGDQVPAAAEGTRERPGDRIPEHRPQILVDVAPPAGLDRRAVVRLTGRGRLVEGEGGGQRLEPGVALTRAELRRDQQRPPRVENPDG